MLTDGPPIRSVHTAAALGYQVKESRSYTTQSNSHVISTILNV